ncbi:MAG: 5-(carboxyamino)imidazole ribonucleotide mutase [Chlorobiota bacterium]|jgi:5-(carboxyamino)imidazole ribonucleotide mutase|nr:5-(carboxyamino)imidazole ribonucleotide mutase [Chlorobiota bacterium]QQS66176.1 MAG: 5-(carboxyamino)imidazole ribonucleotide mutase [Chlorobiota bacterium]
MKLKSSLKSFKKNNAQVAIIMGSDSDLHVMQLAAQILDEFEISYELTIVSAHRTPQRMYDFAINALENGIKVIIAGAGGSAHLPGMVASITPLPVIGVPIMTKTLNGVDSLYSIVQMPTGIPVATVAINGAANAGLLAVRMLALSDENLILKMKDYQLNLKNTIESKANKLEKLGYKNYKI